MNNEMSGTELNHAERLRDELGALGFDGYRGLSAEDLVSNVRLLISHLRQQTITNNHG